jgi:hypothetical protein
MNLLRSDVYQNKIHEEGIYLHLSQSKRFQSTNIGILRSSTFDLKFTISLCLLGEPVRGQ